jgi:alkanesulfonate monooxygenase SsuD/methylene tetrahydromethanopterin reductase-like flavin-dependent oxidoreductase (luciferase family)
VGVPIATPGVGVVSRLAGKALLVVALGSDTRPPVRALGGSPRGARLAARIGLHGAALRLRRDEGTRMISDQIAAARAA